MLPPASYVVSSIVARTCALPRTLAEKLYHSSARVQRCDRCSVDGCVRSSTRTVPGRPGLLPVAACPGMSAPIMSSHHW
ncbi:Uncharacterised protein [Mycobacteroides abscessus]|nr:Uncharacterised protein [Mycobacteroides abscessus]